MTLTASAWSQAPTKEKAQELLEEVKKRALDSQIALKRIELQRLHEDLEKLNSESSTLQQTIANISSAIAESNDSLEKMHAQKKHLTQLLELSSQRIEAEKLKVDGLNALGDAQARARDRVIAEQQETNTRLAIGDGELASLVQKFTTQEPSPEAKTEAGKAVAEIAELRKKLEKSERATATAQKAAREAMAAATEKLIQANAADQKAKKTAADGNLDVNEGMVEVPVRQAIPIALPPKDEATKNEEKPALQLQIKDAENPKVGR